MLVLSAPRYLDDYIVLAAVATVVKIACFVFFKMYRSLWRHAGSYELFTIVTATFVSNSIMLAFVFVEKRHTTV